MPMSSRTIAPEEPWQHTQTVSESIELINNSITFFLYCLICIANKNMFTKCKNASNRKRNVANKQPNKFEINLHKQDQLTILCHTGKEKVLCII